MREWRLGYRGTAISFPFSTWYKNSGFVGILGGNTCQVIEFVFGLKKMIIYKYQINAVGRPTWTNFVAGKVEFILRKKAILFSQKMFPWPFWL